MNVCGKELNSDSTKVWDAQRALYHLLLPPRGCPDPGAKCPQASQGVPQRSPAGSRKDKRVYVERTEGQVGTHLLISLFFQTGAPGQDSLPPSGFSLPTFRNIHRLPLRQPPSPLLPSPHFPHPHLFLTLTSEDLSPPRFQLRPLPPRNPPGQGLCRHSDLLTSPFPLRKPG